MSISTPTHKKVPYVLNIRGFCFKWNNLPLSWIFWFWKLGYSNRGCTCCPNLENAMILCSPHLFPLRKGELVTHLAFRNPFSTVLDTPHPRAFAPVTHSLCLELSWPTWPQGSSRLHPAFTHRTLVRPPCPKLQTTTLHTYCLSPSLVYFFSSALITL